MPRTGRQSAKTGKALDLASEQSSAVRSLSRCAKVGEPTKPNTKPTRLQRAAIYARVSTHNGQDPEMQLLGVREYCARRGWQVAGEYVDRGISGSKERRPELDRLLSDCRKRYVDAVVVYRYDRFARSLRQLVNALEEFRGLGI